MSVPNGSLPSEDSATIFSTLPGQFPPLNQNEKIKTQDFLDASSGVVILIEKFGKVFSPVIYDMNGNIKKITGKYEQHKDKENYQYIEDLILEQRNSGNLVVVDALQWLRRALHFVARFFELIIDDNQNNNFTHDLSPFIKSAYRETLERYHGWLGGQLFNILSRFTPNRRHLFYTLAMNVHNKDDYVLRDMREFTQKMSLCVQKLITFYEENNLETDDRV